WKQWAFRMGRTSFSKSGDADATAARDSSGRTATGAIRVRTRTGGERRSFIAWQNKIADLNYQPGRKDGLTCPFPSRLCLFRPLIAVAKKGRGCLFPIR